MKKINLLICTLLLSGFSYVAHAQLPVFIGGHAQSLTVCENSGPASIDTLLAVGDTSTGHTVNWIVVTGAAHGTLAAAYSTTSAADTLTPTGLTYTPASGYSGNDTFTVSFADGAETDTTTIAVTINHTPNAGTLLTPDSVCVGGHLALVPGGDTGGVWHSANLVSATVNDTGRVTGLAPGSSRIAYIVTTGCGTDTAFAEVKVQTPVQPIMGGDTVCPGQMLTLLDPSAGGAWSSSSFFTAIVFDGIVIGAIPGSATITYTLHNACGATTATLNVTVESDCATGVNTLTNTITGLNISPNPNNGAFTLNMITGTNELATVIITNMVGEKVKEFTTVTNQATELNLNKPSGLYFIKATTPDGIYTAKVVINQ